MSLLPWIQAARPKTLPAAAAPVWLGTALARAEGVLQWMPALLCLAFALLVQIGTNFANDYFDFQRGADTPERKGPTRAVAAGLIAPGSMKFAAAATLAAAFLVGCCLIPFGGWWLLSVGLTSVVLAVAYTAGPFPLAYKGLGDLFVVVFFGFVAVGFTFYVQAGYFLHASWWVGLGVGFLINNLLVVNNLRDVETDRKADKKTLAVRFGRTFSLAQYQASGWIAALIAVPLLPRYGAETIIAGIGAVGARLIVRPLRRAETRGDFDKVLAQTSLTLILYAVALGSVLWLARPAGL